MAPRPPSVKHHFLSTVADTLDLTKVGSGGWNTPLDVDLGSVLQPMAALDIAADTLAYFTGVNDAALTALTAFARQIIAAADAASVRTLLGTIAKAGDNMTGNLDFGGLYSATGLRAPTASTDAATKAYVDALATLVSGALVFKGAWDASAGTFPGGGVAQTGWFYKVSVAGTVNGQAFTVGDDVFAIVNNASTATYAGNWLVVQGTITLAEVQAAVGFTFGALAQQSSVTASQISDASANGRSLITAANYAAMLALLGLETGTARGDAVYTITASDAFVYTNAVLTASRTWTLPAANAVNAGHRIIVADMAAGVSATNTLVLARAGTDTISTGGATGATSCTLDTAGMMAFAVSDGASKWFIFRHAPYGTAAGQAVRLDGAGKLPAIDGSQLTNITTGLAHGQCVLVLSGGNLVLKPKNGNKLIVNGVQCTIPSAGVSLAPTGLTPSTGYYIYATASAGAVNALEASTTTHATDASTGIEIKSGDATRTLVGWATPLTGPAFADTAQNRLVASYFNRRRRDVAATQVSGVVSAASFTEIPGTSRINFFSWGDDAFEVAFWGFGFQSAAGSLIGIAVGLDSTTVGQNASYVAAFGVNTDVACTLSYTGTAAEGSHFLAMLGTQGGSGGSITFSTGLNGWAVL